MPNEAAICSNSNAAVAAMSYQQISFKLALLHCTQECSARVKLFQFAG